MSLSCKKNEKKEVTRKDMICEPGKHYEMIAKSVSPTLHINQNGLDELITDLFDRFVLCQNPIFIDLTFTNYINSLADVYFIADGTYFYTDYGLNCININDSIIRLFYHPYISPQGTWTLTADETMLTMKSSDGKVIAYKIEELTGSDTDSGYLILSNYINYRSIKYTITSKYKAGFSW
jgi:hypothetical protein